MVQKVLAAWVGSADLRAPMAEDRADLGPIAQGVVAGTYDHVFLLCDQDANQRRKFESWLTQKLTKNGGGRLDVRPVKLSSPTNFNDIYEAVTSNLDEYLRQFDEPPELTFHLSPGTPAMAAIWVILGKTRYRARLIQSSRQKGVEVASVPFDIALSPEFVADVLRAPDQQLERLSSGTPDGASQFGDIIYRGAEMQRLIDRARRAAPRSVPVLIEGESGTGKELLARAIHGASLRKNKAFQVVNCGAIPHELVESELFGHEKGAFTGAVARHTGYFEAADGGTLFLDEIGELPLSAQVKLLRALQEGEVRRVGSTKTIKVDVRIIAATNRNLSEEVANGRFREDLFYRLAVLILRVPPLRERDGDLGPLIDGLLAKINQQSEAAREPGFVHKTLSATARNILTQHRWPGNIRELENTLRRASVWSADEIISDAEIADMLLPAPTGVSKNDGILDRSLSHPINLQDLLRDVSRHYLRRALKEAAGNKTRAAKILGLSNYQTLSNWMERYGIAEE